METKNTLTLIGKKKCFILSEISGSPLDANVTRYFVFPAFCVRSGRKCLRWYFRVSKVFHINGLKSNLFQLVKWIKNGQRLSMKKKLPPFCQTVPSVNVTESTI